MIATPMVTLSVAAAHLAERTGKRPHVCTVLRWIQRGVRGRKLPAVRQGGQWLVALSDVDSFAVPGPAAPPVVVAHQVEVERLQLAALLGRDS
jgi:hypothetical protein